MLRGPGAFSRHILPSRLLGSMLGPDLVMLSGVYVVVGIEHVKHTSLSFTLSPQPNSFRMSSSRHCGLFCTGYV